MYNQQIYNAGRNVQVVKTDYRPSGETVQLVRPISSTTRSTDEIVGELVNKFDYKTKANTTTRYEVKT